MGEWAVFSLSAGVALLRSDTLGQRDSGIWKVSYLVSRDCKSQRHLRALGPPPAFPAALCIQEERWE